MSELKTVIKEGTWNERLMNLIGESGKPLQIKDIQKRIDELRFHCPNIRVYILNAKKSGYLKVLKYPGMPSFYCHPDWINVMGILREDYSFNPFTKEFKKVEYEQ